MKLEKDIVIPANLEINPYTYLDIVLKFEPYLKLIEKFGGYMFLKHIYKFSSKAERNVFTDIHSMKESKLIKIISVNNNNYVLLTRASIKYLKNKPNVAHLQPPTSTQLKTCCYLAEYLTNPADFFYAKKPYEWFLEKYKNEIEKYKNNQDPDINFITKNKNYIKAIKEEETKAIEGLDMFSKLSSSRIYIDSISDNGIIDILILDFDRSKAWIYRSLFEKVEPIFKTLSVYMGYNVKILTLNEGREKRLKKDISKIDRGELIFLKSIQIVNLNIETFFQSTTQKESFLKDIDKLEIAKLQERLMNKE